MTQPQTRSLGHARLLPAEPAGARLRVKDFEQLGNHVANEVAARKALFRGVGRARDQAGIEVSTGFDIGSKRIQLLESGAQEALDRRTRSLDRCCDTYI